jgi:hypothetical protein
MGHRTEFIIQRTFHIRNVSLERTFFTLMKTKLRIFISRISTAPTQIKSLFKETGTLQSMQALIFHFIGAQMIPSKKVILQI